MIRFLSALSILFLPSVASACNIPVFRYALERWSPDVCDVIVFHDAPLSTPHQEFVDQLNAAAIAEGGSANIRLTVQDVTADLNHAVAPLWEELREQTDGALPHLVVRSGIGGAMTLNTWHGPLDKAAQVGLLDSPARRALSQRLLAGDAVVWLVLKSNDEERNQAAIDLLNKQLKVAGEEIPLPEGIGLPGSELFSDIPLLTQYSVLEVDSADPQEQFLAELLRGFEPEVFSAGDPLIVPVFGRGRALEVIPASQVDERLVDDLTFFLCGACSCQVKDRNPGFDLLLSVAWEDELFGDSSEQFVPRFAALPEPPAEPELVEIPPGRPGEATALATTPDADAANPPLNNAGDVESTLSGGTARNSVLWIMICLVAVVVVIAGSRSLMGEQTVKNES